MVTSVQLSNFPAKKLRKIRAPKIRMRRIFLFLHSVSKLNNNNDTIKELNFNNKSHTQANNCFNFIVLYFLLPLIQ